LADSSATVERVYELKDLPRLQTVLAELQGSLHARFAFANTEDGRAGVTVAIEATPILTCQRCLEPFALPVTARSEIEFAPDEAAAGHVAAREPFVLSEGTASMCDLAEEELLLALPVAPACAAPEKCGRAPSPSGAAASLPARPETVRPFSVLQELLKKPS
jgi:uncharacterized protein